MCETSSTRSSSPVFSNKSVWLASPENKRSTSSSSRPLVSGKNKKIMGTQSALSTAKMMYVRHPMLLMAGGVICTMIYRMSVFQPGNTVLVQTHVVTNPVRRRRNGRSTLSETQRQNLGPILRQLGPHKISPAALTGTPRRSPGIRW